MVRQRTANPLFPSSNLGAASIFAPIAQLDRVSDYESEGWGFESLWAHHFNIIKKNGGLMREANPPFFRIKEFF